MSDEVRAEQHNDRRGDEYDNNIFQERNALARQLADANAKLAEMARQYEVHINDFARRTEDDISALKAERDSAVLSAGLLAEELRAIRANASPSDWLQFTKDLQAAKMTAISDKDLARCEGERDTYKSILERVLEGRKL